MARTSETSLNWIFTLFILTAALAAAQQTTTPPKPPPPPDAEYLRLEITYRVESGPRIRKSVTGELRLMSAEHLAQIRRLEVVEDTSEHEARLRELTLIRNGAPVPIKPPARQAENFESIWDVAEAQVGDVIRFSYEQPASPISGKDGQWWYAANVYFSYPVRAGSLILELPSGFKGTVDSKMSSDVKGRYEWGLTGTARERAGFVVSTFTSWAEFSSWMYASCPVRVDDTTRAFAAEVSAPGKDAAAKARLIATALEQRFNGHAEASPCQADNLFDNTDSIVNSVDIATLFSASLAAIEIPSERYLVWNKQPGAVNPEELAGMIVRARLPSGDLWFDVENLDQLNGLRVNGTEAALPLVATGAEWISPLVKQLGVQLEPSSVNVRATLLFSASGELQGRLSAEGDAALSPARKLATVRSAGGAYELSKALFLTPADLRIKTPLHLTDLVREPVQLDGGGVYLGAPGTHREEIRVQVPSNRRLLANIDIQIDEPFARYESHAHVKDAELLITREYEVRRPVASSEETTAALEMFDRAKKDQEQTFEFRRMGAVDWNAWLATVPANQLNNLAYKAFLSAEYEGLLAITEHAAQVNPKDEYPWRLRGVVLQRFERMRDAAAAYKEAIDRGSKVITAAEYSKVLQLAREGDEALMVAEKALAANPTDAALLNTKTGALSGLHQWNKATANMEETLRLPNLPDAARAAVEMQLATVRVCSDNALDPERELQMVTGNRDTGRKVVIVGMLVECRKGLDVAEKICSGLMTDATKQPPKPASGQQAPPLDPRGLISSYGMFGTVLGVCGEVRVLNGDVEAGLEFLRTGYALTTSAVIARKLAQYLWENNHRDEAIHIWREAVALAPELVDKVPEEIRDQIKTGPAPFVSLVFRPVESPRVRSIEVLVPEGETLYFIARADGLGLMSDVFDFSFEPAPQVQSLLRRLSVDPVTVNGKPFSSAHMILVRNNQGKVEVLRSSSPVALNIFQTQRPEPFATPPSSTAIQTLK